MEFSLSQEQQQLAVTVRDLLARRSEVRSAVQRPAGYDEHLWTLLCEQVGVAALAIPEEYGGAGFSFFETAVVLEELGADLTPSPMLGSAVLAAQALLLCGNTGACKELLPGIADGTRVAALAWADDAGWQRPGVTAQGRFLTGEARYVLDGHAADTLLVLAATASGVGLFRVEPADPRVRRTAEAAMDPTLRLASVSLDAAEGEPLGAADPWLATLRDVGASGLSALAVGAAQRCLDMTVAHAKQRVQFGRPIGSFQALKHRMADMLVDVETSRSASWAACWAAATAAPDLPERAATAKAWCCDALNRVAGEMVQLHGGVAITWEHDAQLYFKRAHALSQLLGQPHLHRHRLRQTFGI